MSIACPTCRSATISVDYEANVTIRFVDGEPSHVFLGGFTGSLPLQLFCPECGEMEILEVGRPRRIEVARPEEFDHQLDLERVAEEMAEKLPERYRGSILLEGGI